MKPTCQYMIFLTLSTVYLTSSENVESRVSRYVPTPGVRNNVNLSHLLLKEARRRAKCYKIKGDEKLPELDEVSLFWTTRAECVSEQCKTCLSSTRGVEETDEDKVEEIEKGHQGHSKLSDPLIPTPLFHCSEKNSSSFHAYFRWQYAHNHSYVLENYAKFSPNYIPRIFLVEQEVNGTWDNSRSQLTEEWFVSITVPNHTFLRIRITSVSPTTTYTPQLSRTVHIIESADRGMSSPKNLRLVKIRQNASEALKPDLEFVVHWESGSGDNATCRSSVWTMIGDYAVQRDHLEPNRAFWAVLNSRKVKTYTKSYEVLVNILEKSDIFEYPDSSKATLEFEVPSCLEFFRGNFNYCAPSSPRNLRIESPKPNMLRMDWDPPEFSNSTNRVDFYDVSSARITNHIPDVGMGPGLHIMDQIHVERVPGSKTWAEIQNDGLEGEIHVSVRAVAGSGSSLSITSVYNFKPIVADDVNDDKLWLVAVISGTLFFVGLVICICWLKYYREKRERKKELVKRFQILDLESPKKSISKSAAELEIDSFCLSLGDVIGEGAFGLVRKAELCRNGKTITVAVKTLRVGAGVIGEDEESRNSVYSKFREEFKILQGLEPHQHIVGLIGIVSTLGPVLVVEYCEHGDLQNYLRAASKVRDRNRRAQTCTNSRCNMNMPETRVNMSMAINEAYFINNESNFEGEIKEIDLLSFSRQVACGMEFLSNNKILHRDLAARNVLVAGNNRTMKIADFGLSRDVYLTNRYEKNSKERIPIKWMALECLLQELYTTKSDVWSFGILMWEIMSWGGSPYPGIDNVRVFDLLKEGYRMEKPADCLDEVYHLMYQCWNENSDLRPSFSILRTKLDEIIESSSSVVYMNLNLRSSEEDLPLTCSTSSVMSFVKNPLDGL